MPDFTLTGRVTDLAGQSTTAPITVTVAGVPGTVNDLSVVSTTPTSVTLAFTEVNDGNGLPANYNIRYALTPISWGTATSLASLTGTLIGARRVITVPGLLVGTYQFQLVAYRGTLNLNAVFGGLSNTINGTTGLVPQFSGVTYYKTNFSDVTLDTTTKRVGPFVLYSYNNSATWSFSTDYIDPGSTRSLKCTIPATGTSDDAGAVQAWFGHGGLTTQPLDPTLNQDFFQQVRFVVGPGSLARVPSGGQLKVHKSVYGPIGSNVNGWVMSEYAPGEVAGKLFSEAEIWSTGNGGDGTPFPWAGALEGHVYDVVYRYHRYVSEQAGTVAIWVDGVKVMDTPKRPYLGDPRGSIAGLCLQAGAVYAQTTSGAVSVYVLFTQATNFPIGAGTASL